LKSLLLYMHHPLPWEGKFGSWSVPFSSFESNKVPMLCLASASGGLWQLRCVGTGRAAAFAKGASRAFTPVALVYNAPRFYRKESTLVKMEELWLLRALKKASLFCHFFSLVFASSLCWFSGAKSTSWSIVLLNLLFSSSDSAL
jgi:hypothetical protein